MATAALPPQLLPNERAALADFTAAVRARYGSRVRDVRLFGSKARGDSHAESDLDVLVVVDDLTNAERMAIWHLSGQMMDSYDVMLGAFVLPTGRWHSLCEDGRLIAREIRRDGVTL